MVFVSDVHGAFDHRMSGGSAKSANSVVRPGFL
jgi:hypothetical protein